MAEHFARCGRFQIHGRRNRVQQPLVPDAQSKTGCAAVRQRLLVNSVTPTQESVVAMRVLTRVFLLLSRACPRWSPSPGLYASWRACSILREMSAAGKKAGDDDA